MGLTLTLNPNLGRSTTTKQLEFSIPWLGWGPPPQAKQLLCCWRPCAAVAGHPHAGGAPGRLPAGDDSPDLPPVTAAASAAEAAAAEQTDLHTLLVVLGSMRLLCSDAQMVADIFVNYDCDPQATPLYERTVQVGSQAWAGRAYGRNWKRWSFLLQCRCTSKRSQGSWQKLSVVCLRGSAPCKPEPFWPVKNE